MILDLKHVGRQLGLLMLVLSALIAGVGIFSTLDQLAGVAKSDGEILAMFLSALCSAAVAVGLLVLSKGVKRSLAQREALILVALSWICGAAISAMPFRLWAAMRTDAATQPHSFDRYVDCYFEAMSGLTTTGATVVSSLATLPRGLLLWRSLTHWLGGLGIVVLFVAVLPLLGVGARRVYKIEAPGPTPEGVTPRIQDTARILWLIYMGLTVLEIGALWLCGMTMFESVCHTLATLATGGFSTVDSSIAGFPSSAVHYVIVLFMVLAGVNFGLYHHLIQGRFKEVFRDPELRLYLTIMAVATVIIAASLFRNPPGGTPYGAAPIVVRDSLFQVVSVQTTTGFCSADFDQWGFVAKATLLLLMFVGGSAGSTGGGIKVVRILIAAKVIIAELEHVYRRNVVRTVKVGRARIDSELKTSTLVYVLTVLALFVAGATTLYIIESSNGADITTCVTASVATLNNIGPGLAKVGATQNYEWFTPASKMIMSVLMLLGRLEVFAIVVLFTPRFWRGD